MNSKKAGEFSAEEIEAVLETTLTVCNFTVVAPRIFREALRRGDTVLSSIKRLAANFAILYRGSAEPLTVPLLQAFLINFTENPETKLVAIDPNNELGLYEIKKPQTAAVNRSPRMSEKKDLRTVTQAGPSPQREETSEGFFETLDRSIKMYQDLLVQQRINGTETADTERVLATLREQLPENVGAATKPSEELKEPPAHSAEGVIRLKRYHVVPATVRTSQTLPKDRRQRAIEEVFHFYAKQCAVAHIRKTFDAVQTEANTLTLGHLLKFVKDFSLPIDLKVP